MASKSRSAQRRAKPNQLADLGIFNLPSFDTMEDDDDDIDESGLESELEAILSGKAPATKKIKPKGKGTPVLDVEQMARDCLKDDDDSEDEANLSNDEDLLNELQTLTIDEGVESVSSFEERGVLVQDALSTDEKEVEGPNKSSTSVIIKERLEMYQEALKAAKLNNDISKVRRYDRALKTLKSLKSSLESGAVINDDDIPPVVKIPAVRTSVDSRNDSIQPVPTEKPKSLLETADASVHSETKEESCSQIPTIENESSNTSETSLILLRRNQYKMSALKAKKDGDKELALNYLKTVKACDVVIDAMNNNQPVDLSCIPPAPPGFSDATAINTVVSTARKTTEQVQTSSDLEKAALAAAADEPEKPELFNAPPPPATVLEALEQRLKKYTETKQTAEEEGNSGKVRRLQRIIKQYESAVKDYKLGRPINFEDLPVPPGFGPIPVSSPNVVSAESKAVPKDIKPPPKELNQPPKPGAQNVPATRKPLQRSNTSSVADKQLEYLLERQKLFRQAALDSKKNGEIQQAMQYLAMSKGFDSMIQATMCGLPIDASTIPTPPQLEQDFVIVDVSECTETSDNPDIFQTLESDLNHQIEVCTKNKEHFLRLGDVTSASRFEKLCLESKKDLSVVQHSKARGNVPKFHYETRMFSIVICNPDLGDNDIEVKICRGINFPNLSGKKPEALDSFVRLEFPIPVESPPQKAKTHVVRDTNNPDFQEQEFKFEFNRKSRSQIRQFKRQMLKLEVFSKGGFLRGDDLLGTAYVKLVQLESKCTIHESFDLMDGRRKAAGGKIEAILRIREPLLGKQVQEVREKWLVIGS